MLRQMAAEDAPEAATAELKAKAERHENEVRVDRANYCLTQIWRHLGLTFFLQVDTSGWRKELLTITLLESWPRIATLSYLLTLFHSEPYPMLFSKSAYLNGMADDFWYMVW